MWYNSDIKSKKDITMKDAINIRISQKNAPILSRVSEIASSRAGAQQFTPTLIEMLAIGLKAYDSGFRLVDEQLINKEEFSKRTLMSVENESAEFSYTLLSGQISHIETNESKKPNADPEKIKFYENCGLALWREKRYFYKLSDLEIKESMKIFSPIIKQLGKTKDWDEKERIMYSNKEIFDNLIKKWGLEWVKK